jgi:hypothetical protein
MPEDDIREMTAEERDKKELSKHIDNLITSAAFIAGYILKIKIMAWIDGMRDRVGEDTRSKQKKQAPI